jgi:hypothetical protein
MIDLAKRFLGGLVGRVVRLVTSVADLDRWREQDPDNDGSTG